MGDLVLDQYASLADDYHWLFDDHDLLLGARTPGVRVAMSSLPPGARVLDAACGIGVDALALARRGLNVTIADASQAMLESALRRFESERVGVAAVHCRWDDLPRHLPADSFDAVLCSGNSIAHLAGEAEMTATFDAFRAVLVPGGMVVLDTHDWELVCSRGSRAVVDSQFVRRNGERCLRTFSWRFRSDSPDVVDLELGFTVDDGAAARYRAHTLSLHPFSRRALRARLRRAGFGDIALDSIPGDDRYTATARRSTVQGTPRGGRGRPG